MLKAISSQVVRKDNKMIENWEQYKDLEYYPDRVCKCGCGGRILVQPHHKYYGIPNYISGHGKRIPMETRTCACECGETFECKVNSKKRYIIGHRARTQLHSIQVSRETRTCALPGCSTTFEVRSTSTQKYCSTECQLEFVHNYNQKPCSRETIEKISDSISKLYLEGFRPKTFYDDGWVATRIGEMVYCRSSYEKKAVDILNSFEDVVTIRTEPLRIPYVANGVRRFYLPDFLVSTTIGNLYLIEVKPKGQMVEKRNQIKFTAAKNYAAKHNMIFLIWTEDILFSNNNGSTTASLQEIVKATVAILSDDGKVMIQSDLHRNMQRQEETTCPPILVK